MLKKNNNKNKKHINKKLNYFILKNKKINTNLYRYLIVYLRVLYKKKKFLKKKKMRNIYAINWCIFKYINRLKIINFKKYILNFKYKTINRNMYIGLYVFSKSILIKFFNLNELTCDYKTYSIEKNNNLNFFMHNNDTYRKIFYKYYLKYITKKNKKKISYKLQINVPIKSASITYTDLNAPNYNKLNLTTKKYINVNTRLNFVNYKFYNFLFYKKPLKYRRIFLYNKKLFLVALTHKIRLVKRVFDIKSYFKIYRMIKKNKIKLVTIKTKYNTTLNTKKEGGVVFNLFLKKKKLKKLYNFGHITKRKNIYLKYFRYIPKYNLFSERMISNLLITSPHLFYQIAQKTNHLETITMKIRKISFIKSLRNKKKKIFKKNTFFFLKKHKKYTLIKLRNLRIHYLRRFLLSVNYLNIKQSKSLKKKVIYNYLFLNKYSIKSFFVDFYIKTKQTKNILKKKKKKKKIFFFNFWKKKLTTFKRARGVHWQQYTNKTIKKRRYKNFLTSFLKTFSNNTEFIVSYFIVKFNLSHIFWKSFTNMYLDFFLNKTKNKTIYQIPINQIFWTFLKKNQSNKKKIKKKIKRWIIRKKHIKKKFWMKSKKKIPNFFSKQSFSSKKIFHNIQYDFLTNYFCILKQQQYFLPTNKMIYSNKLLKLHNFRYKA